MQEPKWQVVWSLNKRTYNEFFFTDYSAAVGFYWDFKEKKDILEVELFRPDRKIITIYPPYKLFFPHFSDGKKRIFLRVSNEFPTERADSIRYRCDIDLVKESITCNTKLDFSRTIKPPDSKCPECPAKQNEPYIEGLDLFRDDETLAYMEHKGGCVFIRRIGDREPECITKSTYYIGGTVFISPDERWIAFTPARKIGDDNGYDIVAEDLYVVEIRKE